MPSRADSSAHVALLPVLPAGKYHQVLLSVVLHVLQEAVQSAIVQGPKAIVQLPSGEQVPVRSLVVPPVKGRKVVLLGDTCDSHAILSAICSSFDLLESCP